MSKNALYKMRDLLGLLIFPILGLLYEYLNEYQQEAVNISTAFDSIIPFTPVFILPYMIWYLYMFGFLIYFWWKSPDVYWKTIIAITIGELVCFIIYFFFQTTVPRPQITGDTILLQLVSVIYNTDEPFNCFPSIHVLTTMIIMLASTHIKGTGKFQSYITQMTGILIILSTLFVKQHVIYDVVASVVLSAGLWVVVFYLRPLVLKLKINTNRNKKSSLSKDVSF
ncbi:phosphatase PAP2 family protein [Metabacillus idriensis]|uniref:phosphatase PAP2 family protein n=1 Tax=Metabacillus idriensis TaxID=324768 RepID=UPI0017490D5B|nr:phosphatase PAP2 family protein [Metabacillus idriensis]